LRDLPALTQNVFISFSCTLLTAFSTLSSSPQALPLCPFQHTFILRLTLNTFHALFHCTAVSWPFASSLVTRLALGVPLDYWKAKAFTNGTAWQTKQFTNGSACGGEQYCNKSTKSSRGLVRDALFSAPSLQTPAQARDSSSHAAARVARDHYIERKSLHYEAYIDERLRNVHNEQNVVCSTLPRSGRIFDATLIGHAEVFTDVLNRVTSREITSLQAPA
jgi:hypothetical protein